jgi:hypothetical protein
MRFALCWVAGLALAISAVGQERRTPAQASERSALAEKQRALAMRAWELRPRRRDEPLRYINLSDNEMREIQDIAQKQRSNTMLNVSPVVEGCPCEEGPMCTDQVYVITYASEKANGLQLSRVKGLWQLGVVQQWWNKYDELRAQGMKMNYQLFESKQSELFREFPSCVGELVPARTAASTQKAESTK